jgi:hypothetical protein
MMGREGTLPLVSSMPDKYDSESWSTLIQAAIVHHRYRVLEHLPRYSADCEIPGYSRCAALDQLDKLSAL